MILYTETTVVKSAGSSMQSSIDNSTSEGLYMVLYMVVTMAETPKCIGIFIKERSYMGST